MKKTLLALGLSIGLIVGLSAFASADSYDDYYDDYYDDDYDDYYDVSDYASELISLVGSLSCGGNRALAMGGVYTATSQGIDALSGNPAGLSLLNKAQLSVGGQLTLWGKDDLEEDYYKKVINVDDYSSKLGMTPELLNIGAAFPVNISKVSPKYKLAGAVGYRSFYDINSKISMEASVNSEEVEETTKRRGLVNMLSFGLGTTILEKYSIGAALNIPLLKGFKAESESEIKDKSTDVKTEEEEEEFDISGGTCLQLGGIVQATPELSVGASYIMGHKIKFEKGKYTTKHDGKVVSEGELSNKKIDIPSHYNIGVSYKASPDLLVSAELQNRPWEDYEIDGNNLSCLESGRAYRFGLEYGSDILLRAGFVWERLPVIDADKDPVNIKTITGGLGYNSNDMAFDVAGVYAFTTYEEIKSYDYDIKQLIASASFKYFFDFDLGQ
ncbi:MAG: outer membrane protein transport protein [bacterium]|nr:outer membrane protein transport protein [bacterium]